MKYLIVCLFTISVAHAKWTQLKGTDAESIRTEVLTEMSLREFRCHLNGYEYPYSIISWYAVNLLPHVFQEDTGRVALLNCNETTQAQIIFDFNKDETIRLIDFYFVEMDGNRNGPVTMSQRAICQ